MICFTHPHYYSHVYIYLIGSTAFRNERNGGVFENGNLANEPTCCRTKYSFGPNTDSCIRQYGRVG